VVADVEGQSHVRQKFLEIILTPFEFFLKSFTALFLYFFFVFSASVFCASDNRLKVGNKNCQTINICGRSAGRWGKRGR